MASFVLDFERPIVDLEETIAGLKDLSKKGPETVNVGGLMKVKVRTRPARRAGMVMNPFTKEMVKAAARPATRLPKVTPLKGLKDLV